MRWLWPEEEREKWTQRGVLFCRGD